MDFRGFWGLRRKKFYLNGGRAGAGGKAFLGQEPGLRKSRARRAPCRWQGAADLKGLRHSADPLGFYIVAVSNEQA